MSKAIELIEAHFHQGVRLPRFQENDSTAKLLAPSGADYVNHVHVETQKIKGKYRMFYDGDRVFIYAIPKAGQKAIPPAIVTNTNLRYCTPIRPCEPDVFHDPIAQTEEIIKPEGGDSNGQEISQGKVQKGRKESKKSVTA